MGYKRDINTIYCYVDLSLEGNKSFFTREQIHSRFSKEIEKIFKKYGLEYEITDLGGMGGGYEQGLIELLKLILATQGLVSFVFEIGKLVIKIPKYFRNILNKIISNESTRAYITLSLETSENWQDKDLGYVLGQKLIVLKRLSDEICVNLKHKYPIIDTDQNFSLFISPRSFSVYYSLPKEQRNIFNTIRLFRLFKGLVIRNNLSISYYFNPIFIRRIDERLNVESSGARMRTPYKKYYLFLSTRIISDYVSSIHDRVRNSLKATKASSLG